MAQSREYLNVKQYNGKQPPARKNNSQALVDLLAKNMKAIRSALPRHLTAERVARVALNNIRHNPKLLQCAPETLCYAIMEASSLGLEIDMRGQAYLVPFWNNKTKTDDVQLIIGYKGMLDLVWRSGKVQSIMAEVVGENDKFEVVYGLNPKLEHIPNLIDGRGEIVAAYAVAIMKDGASHFVVMSRADLDKVRAASKSADSGPWATWTEEMMKKAVLKRLCKLLPLSPEIQRASTIDDQADAGVAQSLAETVIDIPLAEPQEDTEPETQEAEQAQEEKPEKEKEAQAPLVDTSYTFTCPKNDKKITEAACVSCKERKGCPAHEV